MNFWVLLWCIVIETGFCNLQDKKKKKKNVNTLIFHIFILFMYSYFNLCGFHLIYYLLKAIWKTIVP